MSVAAREDAIDFPCCPVWVRHYAAKGLTTGYPAELDYRSPEPPPPPVPDPCRSLQQYRRFYHLDLPADTDSMRRELRKVTLLEDADLWFAERVKMLESFLGADSTPPELPHPDETPRAQRKGIEL